MVCEPWEKKLNPITNYDARFSLPFAVALMLINGKAGLAEFSEENAAAPQIRTLMAKVRYAVDATYQVKDMSGWIEVTLKDGTRYTSSIPEVRGNAQNPIAWEELLDKFNANTSFLGAARSSRIANGVRELPMLSNIDEFMRLLT